MYLRGSGGRPMRWMMRSCSACNSASSGEGAPRATLAWGLFGPSEVSRAGRSWRPARRTRPAVAATLRPATGGRVLAGRCHIARCQEAINVARRRHRARSRRRRRVGRDWCGRGGAWGERDRLVAEESLVRHGSRGTRGNLPLLVDAQAHVEISGLVEIHRVDIPDLHTGEVHGLSRLHVLPPCEARVLGIRLVEAAPRERQRASHPTGTRDQGEGTDDDGLT